MKPNPCDGNSKAPAERVAFLPVTSLHGVGPSLATRLEKLGVRGVQDLLFHLPIRYEDRTQIVPIGGLYAGQRAVIEGQIELCEVAFRGRRTLLCRIADGTGAVTLRFFHFSSAQQQRLVRGARLRCYGEVRRGPKGLEIVHPEYVVADPDHVLPVEENLTPVYSTTEGLAQARLRRLARQALAAAETHGVIEWLPASVLAELQFPELLDAIRCLHQPPPDTDTNSLIEGRHPAQRRLAFEELLAHHLSLRRLRESVRSDRSWSLAGNGDLVERFRNSLQFRFTQAQERVLREVSQDLAQPSPMLRLIQGDVGSGKTVVAAAAALQVVGGQCQAAVMAPTEILAEQHLHSFKAWFEPLGLNVAWLSGRLPARDRAKSLAMIENGDARMIVGTHALFQEGVRFNRLALVIVDEQHRFGVHQRLALREKGASSGRHPHQLVMTATPIPRTLAMTAYADLDSSVIDELPPGRTPVKTVALPQSRREQVVQRVLQACRAETRRIGYAR